MKEQGQPIWRNIRKLQKLIPLTAGLLISFAMPTHAAEQNIDWQQAKQAKSITISKEQAQKIKQKSLTAAMAWHGASPWISAVSRGASDTFEALGIKVVASTDAQFDPAKQVADLENITALKPNILLSLSVDGTSTKQSYQKAINAGAELVLLSNPIPGFRHGKEYVGIVTDDMFGMGKAAATSIQLAFGENAKIGMIFHDAKYFITNNRDSAFRKQVATLAGHKIVVEKGFVKEHETSAIAAAMILQHPDLDVIYVSWDAAAEGVIEALRSFGNRDIKVVTHDLGVNNLLDMAMQRNMLATISDRPYVIGATMAKLGALATLDLPAPHFTLVPYDAVTKDNIADIWQQAFKAPLPKMLDLALKQ